MKKTMLLAKNFNWRMLLVRIVVNMLALLLTLLIVPNIYLIDRRFVTWVVLAVALGVLNAVLKPIIQVLTLRFIFATTGLVVILINAIILKTLSWIFPNQLVVHGFLWALVGGAVLGLSASFLESLFGLSPPIVSEKYPEIRQRVKDRQFYRTQKVVARLEQHPAKTSHSKTAQPQDATPSGTQPTPPPEYADNAAGLLPLSPADIELARAGAPAEPDTTQATTASHNSADAGLEG